MGYSSIYVVAGPRSCGKTTFIEWCRAEGSARALPEEAAGLVEAEGPIYFMELVNDNGAGAYDMLVHVDLLTPFADLVISSEQDLVGKVQAKAFAEYPGAEIFRRCPKLRVLTLRVPRITTLRRWLRRSAEQGRDSVRTIMAQLYADAYGDVGYSAIYAAWDAYVAGLPNAHCWDVVESSSGRGYSVVRTR